MAPTKENALAKKRRENLNRDFSEWRTNNGEGVEAQYDQWLLFDPNDTEITTLRQRVVRGDINSEGFSTGAYASSFPRRVRLSDAALAVLIEAGVTADQCSSYWNLDFKTIWDSPQKPASKVSRQSSNVGYRGLIDLWRCATDRLEDIFRTRPKRRASQRLFSTIEEEDCLGGFIYHT